MYAPISGSRAIRLQASSYIGSQYSVFFIPSLYRFTKRDSRCIERMAAENIVIGWVSRGMARRPANTSWGARERLLKSSAAASDGWIGRIAVRISVDPGLAPQRHSEPGTLGIT